MSSENLYNPAEIAFLEAVWGDGFLSPGGLDEVRRLLSGVDLAGKTIVDIGCGAGGITVSLARDFGAGKVIGLDVEEPVCAHSRDRVEREGLSDRVEIRKVEPGPIPLADGSVDIVFSKDSIVHIADKETLSKDVFRILKPGGRFVASDWLISHDNEPSAEMADYIAKEGLNFGMASPSRYARALSEAGFVDVELTDRNPWYREVAKAELAALSGPNNGKYAETLPPGELDHMIEVWEAMLIVLKSGEHCPHHFRATKPAST